MNSNEFDTLELSSQLELILTQGIFQTFLFNGPGGKSLYKLHDFYVEVHHGSTSSNCRILVLEKPSAGAC